MLFCDMLYANVKLLVRVCQAKRPGAGKAQWGTEAEEGVELDADKLAEALVKAREAAAVPLEHDERKRKYNSLVADGDEPTAEDMEAYRLTRARQSDPLAQMHAGVKAGGEGGYDLV